MRHTCHRCGLYAEGFFNLAEWVCDNCHDNQMEADREMHGEEQWQLS